MHRSTIAGLGLVFLLCSWAYAAPIYVDDDAPPGGNGQSWATAYRFLQEGLTAAAADPNITEIRVAQGTYKPDRDAGHPDGTGSRDATFTLRNNLAIVGGYAGLGAGDPNARDLNLYVGTLSGEIGGPTNPNDNSYHVVTTAPDSLGTAVLDGFTITGGVASGSSFTYSDCGGGLYSGGGPTVANCTFSDNAADSSGGAVYVSGGLPVFTGCMFIGNQADTGGAVMVWGGATLTRCSLLSNTARVGGGLCACGSLSLTDCRLTGNSAAGGSWGNGGGLCLCSGISATLTHCLITDNTTEHHGAGLAIDDGATPLITGCTFARNASTLDGGGLYSSHANPDVDDCLFTANSARAGGGAAAWGAFVASNCRFLGNTGGYLAGGLSLAAGAATLTSCLFAGNHAAHGGGMAAYPDSNPMLRNCTFTGNSAFNDGGAIYRSYGNNPALTNCILWNDTAAVNPEVLDVPEVPDVVIRYSDVGGIEPGTGNFSRDPLFMDPAGADGDPNTWQDNDYRLSPLSPCINAGDPAFVPDPNETDLAGHPRVAFGVVDMGAYEAAQFADCNSNGVADGRDIVLGTSQDLNGNGIPDECEAPALCAGDTNCDGTLTFADIDWFVEALAGESAWSHLPCPWRSADCNGDNNVTFADIDPFVLRLGTTCP
jgi:hypothetical protein